MNNDQDFRIIEQALFDGNTAQNSGTIMKNIDYLREMYANGLSKCLEVNSNICNDKCQADWFFVLNN